MNGRSDGPIIVTLGGVPIGQVISTGDTSATLTNTPFRAVENMPIDLPLTIRTTGAPAPDRDDMVIDLYPETDPETGATVWR